MVKRFVANPIEHRDIDAGDTSNNVGKRPIGATDFTVGHGRASFRDFIVDLNTVSEVVVPIRRADLPDWRPGDAVIAGGTWLFSEPQVHLRRLIDVTALDWPSVTIHEHGLELAATCTVEEVSALSHALPDEWTAAPLFHQIASYALRAAAVI